MKLSGHHRLPAALVVLILVTACATETTDPDPDPPDTTPATMAVVSGNGQSGTAGGVLGAPLVVEVRNADGDLLPDVAVSWTVQSGGGSLSATSTTTDAQGRAQVSCTLGTAPGPNVVRAAVGASLSATFTLTADPPPADNTPASIEVSDGNNQSGTVDEQLANPLAVIVRNAASQPLSGITVTWTVTQGGGAPAAATSQTNAIGIASITYTLGGSPGTETVDAAVQSDPALAQTFTATATAVSTTADVSVQDNQFVPDPVNVAASGTVTWTWAGNNAHNVTWVSGGFTNSGTQTAGTHQVTFSTPGSYDYFCTVHGAVVMGGTVTVH